MNPLLAGSQVHQRQVGEGPGQHRGGQVEDQEGERRQAGRQVHAVRRHLCPSVRSLGERQAGDDQEQLHCQADSQGEEWLPSFFFLNSDLLSFVCTYFTKAFSSKVEE